MPRFRVLLLTIVLIGLVLVMGFWIAGYFISSGLTQTTVSTPVLSVTEVTTEESGSGVVSSLTGTIRQPAECVITSNEWYREGTAFIADDQLRLDLLTFNNELVQLVASTTGVILVSERETTTESILSLVVGYRCKAWQPDLSVFVLTE
jgi:hypothetical protein